MSARHGRLRKPAKGPSMSTNPRRQMAITVFSIVFGALCVLMIWPWNRGAQYQVPQRDAGPDGGEEFTGLPFIPEREEIRRILNRLGPLVAICGKGQPGEVRVHLAISGKTGSVTDARVIKQFAGTDVAKCAIAIVSTAQFPRFRKKILTVTFPFDLPAASGQVDGGSSPIDGG